VSADATVGRLAFAQFGLFRIRRFYTAAKPRLVQLFGPNTDSSQKSPIACPFSSSDDLQGSRALSQNPVYNFPTPDAPPFRASPALHRCFLCIAVSARRRGDRRRGCPWRRACHASALASATGLDAQALARILNLLVAHGTFEHCDVKFAHSPASGSCGLKTRGRCAHSFGCSGYP
jgi:hypothetical protein